MKSNSENKNMKVIKMNMGIIYHYINEQSKARSMVQILRVYLIQLAIHRLIYCVFNNNIFNTKTIIQPVVICSILVFVSEVDCHNLKQWQMVARLQKHMRKYKEEVGWHKFHISNFVYSVKFSTHAQQEAQPYCYCSSSITDYTIPIIKGLT